MVSPPRFLAAGALVAMALAGPLSPAQAAPPAELSRPIATAERLLRERIASDPAHAEQLRLVLARIEMLRGDMAAIRHGQGGVLSGDQQARLLARLAASGHALP